MADNDSFPRLNARTRGFRLGAPRSFTVSPDGTRIVFLRSAAGDDPVNSLWVRDVESGEERCIVDARELGGSDTDLPAEERARRERARERAGGITTYSTDRDATRAVFTLGGGLYVTSLTADEPIVALPAPAGAYDPRLDPNGALVAYVSAGSLFVMQIDTGENVLTAAPAVGEENVTWGVADFAAAEEMGRSRGHWWAPDGTCLLVARVDSNPVPIWWIADPAKPESTPVQHRYPAAGQANAEVTLWRLGMDGIRSEVSWDHAAYPYLATVDWAQVEGQPSPLLSVQNRRQTEVLVLRWEPWGASELARITDPTWVELVPGVPQAHSRGLITAVADRDTDTWRLALDGEPFTPAGWQVRSVIGSDASGVFVTASDEAISTQVVHISFEGDLTRLTDGHGVHAAAIGGTTLVLVSTDLQTPGVHATVHRFAGVEEGFTPAGAIVSHAFEYTVEPRPEFLSTGPRQLNTAVLFPRDHVRGSRRLPVAMAPYGGPHAQRCVAALDSHASNQWLADQGFVVIVADGRGTPGRGPAWERAIHLDVAGPVLEDQIAALHGVAEAFPEDVDLTRVGIHGWSFGGYLSALAVLRRPDVFHAAVAGAPVTEWRLYDTHYTERYLGHPEEDPAPYDATSLLPLAAGLERPLMLIHGLADDNVVAAHSLQLSSALMAAGRPHTFLPLAGVTHMTPQEEVAENLLLLQVAFLKESLGG